eukprot:31027-Pelagococcus_subviridis.AAC.8
MTFTPTSLCTERPSGPSARRPGRQPGDPRRAAVIRRARGGGGRRRRRRRGVHAPEVREGRVGRQRADDGGVGRVTPTLLRAEPGDRVRERDRTRGGERVRAREEDDREIRDGRGVRRGRGSRARAVESPGRRVTGELDLLRPASEHRDAACVPRLEVLFQIFEVFFRVSHHVRGHAVLFQPLRSVRPRATVRVQQLSPRGREVSEKFRRFEPAVDEPVERVIRARHDREEEPGHELEPLPRPRCGRVLDVLERAGQHRLEPLRVAGDGPAVARRR